MVERRFKGTQHLPYVVVREDSCGPQESIAQCASLTHARILRDGTRDYLVKASMARTRVLHVYQGGYLMAGESAEVPAPTAGRVAP